jgi:hypothetical protein
MAMSEVLWAVNKNSRANLRSILLERYIREQSSGVITIGGGHI